MPATVDAFAPNSLEPGTLSRLQVSIRRTSLAHVAIIKKFGSDLTWLILAKLPNLCKDAPK